MSAAEHVEGGMVDAAEISIDGTVVIDASGNWVGPTPAVGWGDLADIPAPLIGPIRQAGDKWGQGRADNTVLWLTTLGGP
jgi:hypothetical protein